MSEVRGSEVPDEELDDAEDVAAARVALAEEGTSVPWEQVRRDLADD